MHCSCDNKLLTRVKESQWLNWNIWFCFCCCSSAHTFFFFSHIFVSLLRMSQFPFSKEVMVYSSDTWFSSSPDPLWEGWFMKRGKSYEKHILVWNKKTEKGVFFASDVFVFSWYFWSCLYSSGNSDDNTKNSIINNRKTYKFTFIMISSFRVPLSTKHIILITLKSLEEQKRDMRMKRKQRGGTE